MESANSEVATFTGITIEEVETYLRMYEEFEAVGENFPWFTTGMDRAERSV